MKLTNGDIFQAREPLQKLKGEKFPVKTSVGLAKMMLKLEEHLKVIDEVRNGLIQKYGQPLKDKPSQIGVQQDSEDFPEFAREFAELMNEEVEVDITKVKLPEKVSSTCDACHHNMDKPFEIEPGILMALDKFVDAG